jgi:hypothetical protein
LTEDQAAVEILQVGAVTVRLGKAMTAVTVTQLELAVAVVVQVAQERTAIIQVAPVVLARHLQ